MILNCSATTCCPFDRCIGSQGDCTTANASGGVQSFLVAKLCAMLSFTEVTVDGVEFVDTILMNTPANNAVSGCAANIFYQACTTSGNTQITRTVTWAEIGATPVRAYNAAFTWNYVSSDIQQTVEESWGGQEVLVLWKQNGTGNWVGDGWNGGIFVSEYSEDYGLNAQTTPTTGMVISGNSEGRAYYLAIGADNDDVETYLMDITADCSADAVDVCP